MLIYVTKAHVKTKTKYFALIKQLLTFDQKEK